MPPLPSMSQQPQHSAGHGDSDRAHPGVASPSSAQFSQLSLHSSHTDSDNLPNYERNLANFFGDALDGALTLLRADGGEIATLDETRQLLVLRARHTHPHAGPLSAGPQSTPLGRNRVSPELSRPGVSTAAKSHDYASLLDEIDEIEEQSTQLLPATLTTRFYHKGERLIGQCWQQGEPVVVSKEEYHRLPGGSAPADPDADCYLAVPIYRPQSLVSLPAGHTGREVIGVIAVYIHDPRWHFKTQDVELLQLHADRIAHAMRGEELARQIQSQTELLHLLELEEEQHHGLQAICLRLLGVVRRMIEAPAFAILTYDSTYMIVSFELAERDEEPVNLVRLPVSRMPPWWGPVSNGQTICVSAAEERALHPDYCHLGWEEDPPVLSVLAAPLMFQNTFIGAIVAGSPRSDVYAPEHARLFTGIGRSAAVVVKNALLADENKQASAKAGKKDRQLSMLNNAVLTLNNTDLDLDKTMQAMASQAAALTELGEVIRCVVFLKDESGKYLVSYAANQPLFGASSSSEPLRIPLNWRNMRSILRDGQFALLDNLDTEWSDNTPIGHMLTTQKMVSCLVLPLVHNNEQLGILAAYTPAIRHHFSSEEMGLLQGVASQGAVAINNALLHRQLQEAYTRQKELDRLKDEFILTVSHEFRTPVTAIEGYVTLISRHGHKLEQEKLSQFAHEIHQATGQLMGMINMLHEANSMSEKPLELTVYPVAVCATAEDAIGLQSPEAKARIRLEIEQEYWALADSERLLHVFSNLVSNAIKYSPPEMICQITAHIEARATLAASGRSQALAAAAPERWLVVGVRDYGEGIPAEDQPKLFQKFVRLPRSLTTSVRGTGLGLWICKQYIEAMGGNIWVESTYGTTNSGSLFQFSLPLTQPPETM